MESGEQEYTVVFSGQVVARQGDLVLHAATMIIHYFSEAERAALPPGDERRLKKLHARGDIKIESKGWVGTGDVMEYFELERKVYLIGNAQVRQGGNLITGATVTLYLDEGRSIVKRGQQPDERVRAFFFANDENQAADSPLVPIVPTDRPANIVVE